MEYMEALLTRKNLLDYVDGIERHPGGTEGLKKVKEFYQKLVPKSFSMSTRPLPKYGPHDHLE